MMRKRLITSVSYLEKDFECILNDTIGVGKCSENDLGSVTCPLFQQLVCETSTDPEEQKIISELKTLLILLVDYLNTTDLSSLKPIPGTAKSKKKSIYGEQDTTPTTIDGDSLKDLLKELGANVKPGYIGTTGQRPIVNVNKTDTDSRKDKYRNQ